MIQGIYDRSQGMPYGVTGLTTARWIREVPLASIRISDLVLTQRGVYIDALLAEPTTVDPYPHVVEYGGVLYLEDGHHRVVRAILRGHETITARKFVIDSTAQ